MSYAEDLYDHYKDLIRKGELRPEEVPSTRALSEEWDVELRAAQEARSLLIADGLAVKLTQSKPVDGLTDELMQRRFWYKVADPDENGCTLWTGRADRSGYGSFRLAGRECKAHVVAYTYLIGPVPPGLELDHVWEQGCRSKLCVRADHLEPVTHSENMRRHAARRPPRGRKGA